MPTGTIDGQLWYVTGLGLKPSSLAGHVNSDGTGAVQTQTFRLGTGLLDGQGIVDIDADPAAGFYFVVDTASDTSNHSTNDPTAVSLISYRISDNTQVDSVTIGDHTDLDLTQALAVDPYNHVIYAAQWGVDLAHSGIVKISYDPLTGALQDATAPSGRFEDTASNFVLSGTTAGAVAVNDVRYITLDLPNHLLYYTANSNGYDTAPFAASNGVFVTDLNGDGTAIQLTSSTQFPTGSQSGGADSSDPHRFDGVDANGYIGPIAVDDADHKVYFLTHHASHSDTNGNTVITGEDALWWVSTTGGAQQTATKVTGVTISFSGENGGLSFDPQTRTLYITNQDQTATSTEPSKATIIIAHLNGDGTGVSNSSTISMATLTGVSGTDPNTGEGLPDQFNVPTGTSFFNLPILTVTGTSTHAVEQSTAVTLSNSFGSTDVDSGYYAGATVQITAGTFSSNETSASDDHLAVNLTTSGGKLVIGGVTSNIVASYNSASETLTLSGYDTIANYNAALAAVQYNATGENPTNYGGNTTRTIIWTVSDGEQNIPAGEQNSGTTTLTIDATDDAPVNHLPGSASASEDVQTAITGITITDVDADPASQNITVTFSVAHGTLNLLTNVASGITAGNISGGAQDSATITITATQNQINATLGGSGLRYTSDLNFNSGFAAESLHIVTSDLNHTGSGGPLTDTDDLAITVNAVNDNPDLQPDTTTPVSYTENAAPTALFSGENVNTPLGDVDQSANYLGGSVDLQITTGLVTGDRISLTGTRFIIVGGDVLDTANASAVVGTIGATNATSHVTISALTANATPSVVDALIQAFGFDSTSDNPFSTDRTVTLTFSDGGNTGGGARTDVATQTVHVTATNDAPVATTPVTHYTVNEQVILSLKNSLSVSDVDGNSGIETITLSVTEGTLTAGIGTSNVTIDSGNGTGSLVISGTIAQLNDFLNTNVTSTLIYIDNTNTPTASATLTLLIHDNGNSPSGDLFDSDTATIDITAVNDAPTALMTQDPYAATEQTTLALKGTGMSVSDADSLGGVERITISVGEGTLDATEGDSGVTIVSGNGTASVTIDGTIAQLNAFLGAGGSSTLSYIDNIDNPSASTTLTLQINDQGHSGTVNNPLTGADTSTINITQVNDPPAATITPASYQGQPNVAIDLKGTGLSVSDVDGGPPGTETVTLSVTHGTLTVTAGTSGVVSVTGSTTNSVTIVGTIAAINALLGSDASSTVSFIDPAPTGPITLTLAIDDDGNTGGGPQIAQDTASIILDIPPVLANAGNAVPYTEQQTSPSVIFVDSAITVTDTDSLTLNSATVKITGGVFAGDILSADTTGTAITAVWNGTDTLTLTGVDTPIDYQHVLQSVTFSSTSDDPTNGGASPARTITWTVQDDFDVASAPVTTTINVTAINDGPAAVITLASYSATEQTALNLKASGLSVSDLDANVNQVSVTLSVTEGTLTVAAGTSGVASVSGSGTNSVTILGTIAQINALLTSDSTSAVTYIDNTDNPSASATLTLLIDDGGATGGGNLTANDTATINITAVNDAPIATITPASYAVTENATLSLKNNGLAVSDVDGNSGSETVTLSVTDGILNVTAGGSGAGVSGSGTNSVTITGTIAQINALLVSDGTSTVDYVENNDNPGTTATLSLAIHDNGSTGGGDLSSTDTATLNITQVNDAPSATITPASYSATEQTTLNLKSNGLSVSDIDGNAGSETVTLSVGEGVLNVTAGGSGATVSNSGTSSVTITGTAAQINALLNTDGASTVSYIDNSDMPAASTTLTLLIHDNGNTGGGDLSSNDAATINITAVNDAPVFTGLDNNPTFVENGAAIVLDNNATIVDPDLAGLGNYAGATLTLAQLNPTPASPAFDDTFGGSGTLAFDATDVRIGATVVGSYTQLDGVLEITFNSSATQSLVNGVLQQLTYSDSNDVPPASVDIGYTFSDNNNGAQGTGGVLSTTGHIVVDITPTNDPPLLFNVATVASYQIGTGGAPVSPSLVVSDPDGPAVNGIAGATVKIASGFFAGDTLSVDVGATGIVASYDSGTHILTLSGAHSVTAYQAVLDSLIYSSTSADPTNGGANANRTIEWQATDTLGAASTVRTTALDFASGPSIDLDHSAAGNNYATTFTENGAAVSIADTDILIQDTNSPQITFAFVTLTNALHDDVLSFSGPLPGGIVGSIDTGTPGEITVSLHGAASPSDYQTAIHDILFSNASDDPDATDRDIAIFVGDTDLNSNTAHTTVHVTAINDAPVNTLPAQHFVTINNSSVLTGLSVADPDAESGTLSTTLSVVNGTLTLGSAGGASVSGSGTSTVVLTGTLSEINVSLSASGNVVYHASGTPGPDTFTMTTDDGGHTGVGGPLTDVDHVDILVSMLRGQSDHFIV